MPSHRPQSAHRLHAGAARQLFALALAALLLAAPARAQSVPVTVKVGQTFTLDADLGFTLACPHFLTIDVLDPSIVEAIDPPATTTKQKFKFRALAFGATVVSMEFVGTSPCPGSASTGFDVTVDPDQAFTEKQFKTAAQAATKQIKLDGLNVAASFDDELKSLRASALDGAIPVTDAIQQIAGLAYDTIHDGIDDLWDDVSDLTGVGHSLLSTSGLGGAPASFQTGAYDSLFDGAVTAAFKALDQLESGMFKKLKASLAKLEKKNDGLLVNCRFHPGFRLPAQFGPDFSGAVGGGFKIPPRITLGIGYLFDGTAGLTVGGVADPSESGAHVTITFPLGASSSMDAPIVSSPGDPFGTFSWSLSTNFGGNGAHPDSGPTDGPADGTPAVTNGLYRIEVRYTADANPADVFFLTVP